MPLPQIAARALQQAIKPPPTADLSAADFVPEEGSLADVITSSPVKRILDTGYKAIAGGISAPDPDEITKQAEIGKYETPALSAADFLPNQGFPAADQLSGIPAFPDEDFNSEISDLGYGNPIPKDDLNPGIMSIVKEKGGNWSQFDEDWEAIGSSYKHLPVSYGSYDIGEALIEQREALAKHQALSLDDQDDSETIRGLKQDIAENERRAEWNDWVDTKLKKYVRNEMATEADPMRQWIKEGGEVQGLVQVTGGDTIMDIADHNRVHGGFDPFGLEGFDTPASYWEAITDAMIGKQTVDEYIRQEYPEANIVNSKEVIPEWLGTMPYGKRAFNKLARAFDIPGISHVQDEIGNAMDPASGLPNDLQIAPGKLGKMSVPDVYNRVADINKWREENLAEADKEKAFNRATHPIEDAQYDNYGWVELKDPDDMSSQEDVLRQALDYEGNVMGHCVGSKDYCDAIRFKNTKIFSLRDSKGEPHVTIEAELGLSQEAEDWYDDIFDQLYFQHRVDTSDSNSVTLTASEFLNKLRSDHIKNHPEDVALHIQQVKGKGNSKLNNEKGYQTMVQDLLQKLPYDFEFKSHHFDSYGKGDINSADMIDIQASPYISQSGTDSAIEKAVEQFGRYVPSEMEDEVAEFVETNSNW